MPSNWTYKLFSIEKQRRTSTRDAMINLAFLSTARSGAHQCGATIGPSFRSFYRPLRGAPLAVQTDKLLSSFLPPAQGRTKICKKRTKTSGLSTARSGAHLNFKKESYQTGGMGGDVNYHMGLEAMEFSAVVADYDPMIISKTGFSLLKKVTVLARAATKNKDGVKIPYEIRVQGNISALDLGTWDLGSANEMSFTMDCDYFRLKVGEVTQIEIDLLNMIQIIGGEDQLAVERAMILRTTTPTG